MKAIFCILVTLLVLVPSMAEASRPVQRTLTGCVIENRFYSVNSDHAYLIRLSPPTDLTAYEQKSVTIKGWLSPGDTFRIQDGAISIVSATCDARSRKAISRIHLVRYRLEALDMAKKGRFTEALGTIGKAFEIDSRNCDTYVDRAHIYCMNNDFNGVHNDMTTVQQGLCADPKKTNYLLLEDLGQCLEERGRKQEALDIYRMAHDCCVARGGGLCKERREKRIEGGRR